MNQIQRLLRFTRILFVFVLVTSLFTISTVEASAASRHHKSSVHKSKKSARSHKGRKSTASARREYYPDQTRQQAIEMIRSNSEQVSELAGLDPLVASSVNVIPQNTPDYEEGEDLEELAREDDVPVDMDSFRMLWLSYIDGDEADASKEGGIARKDIMNIIMDWLGTPYYFGGMTERGIDCSAFVQRVFMETNKIMLPRTAAEQFSVGMKVVDMDKLKFGDMIFFHTRRSVYASHVGIYLGDNLFAHASSRYGVTVSSLQSTYYNNRFIGGRRLSASDMVKLGLNNHNGEDLH